MNRVFIAFYTPTSYYEPTSTNNGHQISILLRPPNERYVDVWRYEVCRGHDSRREKQETRFPFRSPRLLSLVIMGMTAKNSEDISTILADVPIPASEWFVEQWIRHALIRLLEKGVIPQPPHSFGDLLSFGSLNADKFASLTPETRKNTPVPTVNNFGARVFEKKHNQYVFV